MMENMFEAGRVPSDPSLDSTRSRSSSTADVFTGAEALRNLPAGHNSLS